MLYCQNVVIGCSRHMEELASNSSRTYPRVLTISYGHRISYCSIDLAEKCAGRKQRIIYKVYIKLKRRNRDYYIKENLSIFPDGIISQAAMLKKR